MVKGTEKKAILCTSPSSDSKLTVANIRMQAVYHFAGSWPQSVDVSIDSQLDISQPHIMSLTEFN